MEEEGLFAGATTRTTGTIGCRVAHHQLETSPNNPRPLSVAKSKATPT